MVANTRQGVIAGQRTKEQIDRNLQVEYSQSVVTATPVPNPEESEMSWWKAKSYKIPIRFGSVECRSILGEEITHQLRDTNDQRKFAQFFNGRLIVVTGGASFIGSHLVDKLLSCGATVRVVDDHSSGRREHLVPHKNLEVVEMDLKNEEKTKYSISSDVDFVFHLAAVHGGRGFIENQQSAMLDNFAIDLNVFRASVESSVGMVVNTSSACAYPINLQESETVLNLLNEDLAGFSTPEKSFPDGVYGWIKLMGEFQLQTAVESSEVTRGRSARVFTSYGPRENESHAAIALIAKALLGMSPFPIWGSGQQTRNFTYVADTVTGLMHLATDSRELKFDVFNVGTSNHITVMDFVLEICRQLDWSPESFDFQLDKPTGVSSRASDNSKLAAVFDWSPSLGINFGISETLSWYKDLKTRPRSIQELEQMLISR